MAEEKEDTASPAARLLKFSLDRLALWKSPDGAPFCTVKETKESYSIASSAVASLLVEYYEEMTQGNDVLSRSCLEMVITALSAKAFRGNVEYTPATRVHFNEERRDLWVDMGEGRFALINADGWQILTSTSYKFLPIPGARTLPDPDPTGDINKLKEFLTITDEKDFIMVVGWLVGSYLCKDQYPILQVNGPYGSAKSTLSKFVRGLIDPNTRILESPPDNKRDFVSQVMNSHVIAIDNMSYMPQWLSNTLCQISTGISLSSRKLYSQHDVDGIQVSKPVILNGIEQFAEAPDLLSRTLHITLPVLDRNDEKLAVQGRYILERYAAEYPKLLGGLFNVLSAAIAKEPTVQIKKAPRLLKIAYFMTAAEEALGWEEGTWIKAATDNAEDQFGEILANNPVAAVVLEYITEVKNFEGTMTDLLSALTIKAPLKNPAWPKTGKKLGNELRKLENELKKSGIRFTQSARTSGGQKYILELRHDS